MKTCTRCGETKLFTEFFKRAASPDGLNASCKQCKSASDRDHYKKNHTKIRVKANEYSKRNADQAIARARRWYSENKDRALAVSKDYRTRKASEIAAKRAEYAERTRDQKRIRDAAYRENNKAKCNAIDAAKRARKRNAAPVWLSAVQRAQIETEYALAAWCSQVMGTKYHVDHIMPLNEKTVCGLHVPWNLQVIPANDNLRKSNKVAA